MKQTGKEEEEDEKIKSKKYKKTEKQMWIGVRS